MASASGTSPASPASGTSTETRRLVTIWLMVAASLAWVPGGLSRFVLAKLLVVALAWLVGSTVPAGGRLPRSLVLGLLGGAALVAAAALLGDTPVASLVGRWPRYEGLPVLGLYAVSAWLGARVVGRGVRRSIHLAHALAALALVLGAFSVLDALGHSPLGATDLDRSGALLGNATDQGLVAAMVVAVTLSALVDRRDRLLGAGLLAALVTVGLSGSRIALAVAVVSLAAVLLARRSSLPSVRTGLAVVGGGAVVALAAVLAVPVARDRLVTTATGHGRLEQWRLTLDLVGDHALTGIGPNRYVDAFGRYESTSFVRFTGPRALVDSPHDVLLQALVVGGVPLLVAFLVLAVLTVRRAATVLREHPEAWGPTVAVAGYALALLANFPAAGPTCLAAFLLGSVVAEAPGKPSPRPVRLVATATAGLAVLLAATSCLAEVELGRAVRSAERGDLAAAHTQAQRAHQWRPWDSDVQMLAAQPFAAAASAGDRAAAARAADLSQASLDATPDTYSSLLASGVAALALDEPEESLRALDRAVRLFPHRPDGYVQRALARYATGDQAGAEADVRRALEIAPRYGPALRVRAALDRLAG